MGPGLVFWREDRLWATEQVGWARTPTGPAGRRRKELPSEGWIQRRVSRWFVFGQHEAVRL